MTSPFTLKWGIMSTGAVAQAFSKDLLTNPASRNVVDVNHQIVAVASRSLENAESFISRIESVHQVSAYGSYTDLVKDPNVSIIYIATPHSHHFQNAMLALSAGKHVLCEKAFTVTAQQTRRLVEVAREKKLFLMEAVWTRFMPLSTQIRELVSSGEIGTVSRVTADLSFNRIANENHEQDYSDSHRTVNLDLAGGTLLNYGLYSLTWVFQILYHLQPQEEKELPVVVSAMNKYRTGVDQDVAVVCHFPNHGTTGIATSSLRVATQSTDSDDVYGILIQGSKGEIDVAHPAYQPSKFRVTRKGASGSEVEVIDCPVPKDSERNGWGHGFFWEADHVARCIRDGKTESDVMPLSESMAIMDTIGEVMKQGGLVYPESIASCEYKAESMLNTGGG